jgi:hypothetical protein
VTFEQDSQGEDMATKRQTKQVLANPAAKPTEAGVQQAPTQQNETLIAEGDPLRIQVCNLSAPDKAMLKDRLLRMISEEIAAISSVGNVQAVARFIDTINNVRGFTTPAEQFIENILNIHYREGLTSERVMDELTGQDGLSRNLKDTVHTAERFTRMYPNGFPKSEEKEVA